jgi:addiction module HigA family antidote
MTMAMMHNPASPGELLQEFLGKRTATELAEHIGVACATISRILNGRTSISMDISIRLGEALGLSGPTHINCYMPEGCGWATRGYGKSPEVFCRFARSSC